MRKQVLFLLVLLVALLCVEMALAQPAPPTHVDSREAKPLDLSTPGTAARQPADFGLSWQSIVRMFAWLALLIIIIFAVLTVMRNLLPSARLASGSSRIVKVLAKSYLTPKQAVYIVQIAKSLFVLGVTAESVTNLGRITDDEEIELILEQTGAQERDGRFTGLLRGAQGYQADDNPLARVMSKAKGEIDRLKGKMNAWRTGRAGEG